MQEREPPRLVQVDSDDEEVPQRREDEADVGVKEGACGTNLWHSACKSADGCCHQDLADGRAKKKPILPVPDFLQGSTAGGGQGSRKVSADF